MKYRGSAFTHDQSDLTGILLVNLGTPEEPTAPALRKYLAEFLSDPRVVELPRLLWLLILHGIILRVRPAKSAKAYQSIWTDAGSPLKANTEALTQALDTELKNRFGAETQVRYAMRYGQPSVSEVTDQMLSEGVRRVLILPLYPQYSGTTTASVFDALADDFKRRRWLPHFEFIASYHDFPPYIEAMASAIRSHWQANGKAQKLVFSFHGVPQHVLHAGDPYHCQCHVTARLLATQLGLDENEYLVTFQSRFGKAEWLKPYTDETLKAQAKEGVKSLQVYCPGFSADCLETLEEIAEENREYFLEAGGETYEYIPALNASPVHVEALADLLTPSLTNWSKAPAADMPGRANRFASHPYNQSGKNA